MIIYKKYSYYHFLKLKQIQQRHLTFIHILRIYNFSKLYARKLSWLPSNFYLKTFKAQHNFEYNLFTWICVTAVTIQTKAAEENEEKYDNEEQDGHQGNPPPDER